MRDQISKTIIFSFENRFAKTGILQIRMPYIPFLCLNGRYSRLYAGAKKALMFSCDPSHVVGKHSFEERKTKRTVITLFNGFSIDFPHDLSRKDLDIIDGDLLDSISNYNMVVINGYEYERKPPVYEAVGGRLRTGKVEPLKAVVTDNDSILRYGEMYIDSTFITVKIVGISYNIEHDNVHPAKPHTHSNVNNPNGEFYICKKR